MLRAENISYAIGNKMLLEPTTISFDEGSFHVIMGSNGAGKSTLVKLFAGDIKPKAGTIYLNDIDLQQIPKVELAKRRAVLSQHYAINFPINVNDIVLMGRYPYYSNNPTSNDIGICEMSKQLMEVSEFGERDYNTLSGGEAQKVQMSRVLAQIWEAGKDSKILFLDEPVSHLDIRYQYQLLKTAKDLCKKNITVIAILHDINLSIAFADRIFFMKKGKVVFDLNDPNEVTTNIIDEVFGVQSKLIEAEGRKVVVVIS